MLQHTRKFSPVPQCTVNNFTLIVSSSGYLDHLGLFSYNGFHMFLGRYHHVRKKNANQMRDILVYVGFLENFKFAKTALPVMWRGETAKNDSIFLKI